MAKERVLAVGPQPRHLVATPDGLLRSCDARELH